MTCFIIIEFNTTGYRFYGGSAVATTIPRNWNINTIGSVSCTSLTTTNSSPAKIYVGAYVFINVLSTTVKPGFITSTLTRPSVGQYVFTMTAHPSGVNYMVMVQQRTALAATAAAMYGVIVNSSTSFTVFSKTTANVLVDFDFYVHTGP